MQPSEEFCDATSRLQARFGSDPGSTTVVDSARIRSVRRVEPFRQLERGTTSQPPTKCLVRPVSGIPDCLKPAYSEAFPHVLRTEEGLGKMPQKVPCHSRVGRDSRRPIGEKEMEGRSELVER